jgi:hypothetical protein
LSSHTNATTHHGPVPAIAHDQRREPVSPWSSATAANTQVLGAGELAGEMREGLLALAVGTGLQVLAALM